MIFNHEVPGSSPQRVHSPRIDYPGPRRDPVPTHAILLLDRSRPLQMDSGTPGAGPS